MVSIGASSRNDGLAHVAEAEETDFQETPLFRVGYASAEPNVVEVLISSKISSRRNSRGLPSLPL
jgi:hypothetical protein